MGRKGPFESGGKLKFEGKVVERVVSRSKTKKGRKYTIEQTTSESCKTPNLSLRRTLTSATTVDDEGFLMHSQSMDSNDFLTKFYVTPPMKCRPPLRILNGSAKPGDTWKVGKMKGGGMKVRIKAKVLEPESVKTDSGPFANA